MAANNRPSSRFSTAIDRSVDYAHLPPHAPPNNEPVVSTPAASILLVLVGLASTDTATPVDSADPDSDEGYVMSYVHDENTGKTDFVVLDATDMTKDPIAKVTLPQRVPYGFHGNFIAD